MKLSTIIRLAIGEICSNIVNGKYKRTGNKYKKVQK